MRIHGSNPALSATNWVSVLSRVFDFYDLQILPLVQGLCANRAMTVFTQRRIRAAFAAIAARASRLRILVVRRSLPGKPNSRWASETHNEETLEGWSALAPSVNGLMQTRNVAAARSTRVVAACRPWDGALSVQADVLRCESP